MHLLSVRSPCVVALFLNSSGKIPMMEPCMNSSSEMQIKANVLLWKAERFICGRFLRRDPAVGQS